MWQQETEESYGGGCPTSASRDQQSLAADGARTNQMNRVLHVARRDENSRPGVHTQMQEPASRSGGEQNWSAQIRASITRLMEMEEVCLNPYKAAEKRKAREAELAFHAKVDQLEAESEIAHNEYWERLRNVYSTSTAKKMRLTTATVPPTTSTTGSKPSSSWQPSHEALDALAVAAATEQSNEPGETATKVKKTNHSSRQQNSLPVSEGTGSEQNPVQVHDPTLVQAVDKLADKLTQLLDQLQAASDDAVAEPILAAAANIALEVTEMRRCEEVAMTRMVEIEEHRQQIMQGLLEYAKRKEQRGSEENAISTSSSRDSPLPLQSQADTKHT